MLCLLSFCYCRCVCCWTIRPRDVTVGLKTRRVCRARRRGRRCFLVWRLRSVSVRGAVTPVTTNPGSVFVIIFYSGQRFAHSVSDEAPVPNQDASRDDGRRISRLRPSGWSGVLKNQRITKGMVRVSSFSTAQHKLGLRARPRGNVLPVRPRQEQLLELTSKI